MPNKFRKALGAVKDQTSISIAKVYTNNGIKSNIEVIVLKATRHDEVPVDDKYVKELLNLIYSNKVHAASCAQVIGKRIGKTRNWIVALKSLMLVFRILQDGDPYFPREVHHAMKRGTRILNLSTFRDDSHSSPWDYTAFVRTFALYLDERLDCFLKSKLQRRLSKRCDRNQNRTLNDPVCELKPAVLLDKISFWQKLLDRAIGTRPTGGAKTNKLVKISLYAVAEESFDLYRDISDGLALLLDSFFHLQYEYCVGAFQLCVKASKQFEELCGFYDLCKSIGVGRTSEYPSVQKISEELLETLKEFLKDEASFPSHGRSLPASPPKDLSSTHDRNGFPKRKSMSLEDLMSVTDVGTSFSTSMDCYLEQFDKQLGIESATDSGSNHSYPLEQGTISGANSVLDLVSLEDWPPEDVKDHEQEHGQLTPALSSPITAGNNCWEIVLAETANQPATESQNVVNGFEPSAMNIFFDHQEFEHPVTYGLFDQAAMPQHQYNPFLQDNVELPIAAITSSDQRVFPVDDMFDSNDQWIFPIEDIFSVAPTFQATPTFSVKDHEEALPSPIEDDPFAPCTISVADIQQRNNGFVDPQILRQEQQLWLQNQDKIIAKYMA